MMPLEVSKLINSRRSGEVIKRCNLTVLEVHGIRDGDPLLGESTVHVQGDRTGLLIPVRGH